VDGPGQAGLWGVVGGLVGLLIARLMGFEGQQPKPLPWGLASRHAVVLAVAAGLTLALEERLDLAMGYWVTVTLLVALRPVPGERRTIVTQRIAGTLLGAFIALVVVLLVPTNLLMVVAIACLVALAAYSMSGNYVLQTAFLTPMLMIFMSASEKEYALELTVGRVLYTIIGVLLALLLTMLMAVWDRRSGLIPGDPVPAPLPEQAESAGQPARASDVAADGDGVDGDEDARSGPPSSSSSSPS